MKRILFINFLLILAFEGNCQITDKLKNELKTGWKLLEKYSFSIQYPSTWDFLEDSELYLYPKQEDISEEVIVGISLNIVDLTEPLLTKLKIDDLNKYIEFEKRTFISKIIEDERLENGNHRLVYSEIDWLIEEDYYHIINDKIYVLKFTAKPDEYHSYKKVAREIMSTFKIN
jgi:hypothetical protein